MALFLKISRAGLVIILASLALFFLAIYAVPLPERLDPPASTVVTFDDGQVAHVFLAADERWRIKADHRQVDPDYLQALLALEDKRFWSHPGVDILAILRAANSNIRRGKIVSGASTITMQVVRMSEPRPRRIFSKLIEAFRAIQVEHHHTKEEILDIYLSLLPFGGNYEGLETASLAFFGHDASRLSPAEIATLLAIPQAPSFRQPAPKNEQYLRAARNKIARQLLEQDALPRGMLSERITVEEAIESIEKSPVPTEFRPMPREIPHLAIQMRRRYPEAQRLQLAIDRSMQVIAESMVAQHRTRIEEYGADHVAVVIMDHQTGELKAAVGNFEYSMRSPGLAIPAYDISRSTGSLLKPFVLARAIDKGLAAPSHRVTDIPINFRGYRPQNFGGHFDGLVRLDDALSRSLNIPFVNLLNEVGVEDFLATLHRLGAPYEEAQLHEQGLSIAIGGVELTPLDVARLYAALARKGHPVKVQRMHLESPPELPLASRGPLSAESAWLTRELLQRRGRPGFTNRAALRGEKISPYAWKTGTSMGHRDAWTAGLGPRYVVVVWTGNLDHRPGRGLLGERAAAPLFFDIIEAIDPPPGNTTTELPPSGLHPVEVCAFSGHLPKGACNHRVTVDLPRQSIPTKPCPYHIEADVDLESGLARTPACRGDHETETRSFLSLPPQVLRFFDPTGGTDRLAPPLAPGCRSPRTGSGPSLISPPPQTTIALLRGLSPSQQQIPLEAATEAAGELDWFVNGRFIGQTRGSERLWWEPSPGTHEFVVADAQGRTDSRVLEVR